MNVIAWAWTSGGEAKVDRPIASWNEKPAKMTKVITIAAFRKKRSSPAAEVSGAFASVAIDSPMLARRGRALALSPTMFLIQFSTRHRKRNHHRGGNGLSSGDARDQDGKRCSPQSLLPSGSRR